MNFDVVAKGAPRAEAASYPGCQTLPARNRADMPALANVGLAFSRQQHYQEAADCYRKALSIEPKLRAFQLNLGLAEFKLGDFKAALGPLGAVLAIDPQNLQARTLLGMSYYGAGMYARFPSWTGVGPRSPQRATAPCHRAELSAVRSARNSAAGIRVAAAGAARFRGDPHADGRSVGRLGPRCRRHRRIPGRRHSFSYRTPGAVRPQLSILEGAAV